MLLAPVIHKMMSIVKVKSSLVMLSPFETVHFRYHHHHRRILILSHYRWYFHVDDDIYNAI